MKLLSLALSLVGLFFSVQCQTISGHFSLLSNQQVRLEGFNGFKTEVISQCKIDNNGNFTISFSKENYGVGYLVSSENIPFLVILTNEDIHISGESLLKQENIKFIKGNSNIALEQFGKEQRTRDQALNAWLFLEKFYQSDSVLMLQKQARLLISQEISRIKEAELSFIENLPENSFIRWYIPVMKLVSSVSIIPQQRPDEIPNTITSFRKIDYLDHRLYKSGLLQSVIESHFWLIENSGKDLNEVISEMKISIDSIVENLLVNDEKLNLITNYLFDLLERHSLFEASEYLALKLLNETSCTINQDLANQLETYRAMKKGNTAKEIYFQDYVYKLGQPFKSKQMTDLESPYYLVVFGASWCPKCTDDIPQIAKQYTSWKKAGLEVVFISLDTEKEAFENFTRVFPFISYCDFKKWDSQVALDYFVFATPTMFILDKNRKIILRPNSLKQVEAWIDWFLVKGN